MSGRQHVEHALPIDPSSMTGWHNRVGVKVAETLLSQTIRTGIDQGYLKRAQCERVSVDTTVQTKDIRFPTDAGLYDRMREVWVRAAEGGDVDLRQSYTRVVFNFDLAVNFQKAFLKKGFFKIDYLNIQALPPRAPALICCSMRFLK